jgi:hypothetical protein
MELDALGDPLFTRIDEKILTLADNPRPAGCRKLKGYKDQWRVRVGDWRVVSREGNHSPRLRSRPQAPLSVPILDGGRAQPQKRAIGLRFRFATMFSELTSVPEPLVNRTTSSGADRLLRFRLK